MSAGPQWRVCSYPHWPRLCRWLTPSALEEDTGSAPGHLHHLFGQLPHGGLDFRDLHKTLHGLHHFCALLQEPVTCKTANFFFIPMSTEFMWAWDAYNLLTAFLDLLTSMARTTQIALWAFLAACFTNSLGFSVSPWMFQACLLATLISFLSQQNQHAKISYISIY